MENNIYLIKALDAYPYDLGEAVESLNYALSCDPNNPMAHCLMGRLYLEIYQDYDRAIEHFESGLEENVRAVQLYPFYLMALIHNEDFDKALKFIDFALTVKSSDKALVYARKALVYECLGQYKQAKAAIKQAWKQAFNSDIVYYLEECEERIKKKQPKKKENKEKSEKSK